ncbi:MAG: hypothetical protein U0992_14425 [Planctomycetaceae bacterium]
MATPFEELEYLSEHLPDEGESVLITRKDGELVCEPRASDGLRDGIDEAELYGLLVECNERLSLRAARPLWTTSFVTFAILVSLFTIGGLGWSNWFVVPGVVFVALWGCYTWIRSRQLRLFMRELRPRIAVAIEDREIDTHALIAGMRQHVELRTLLDLFIAGAERREK